MSIRKGFTLIELLIVVAIIAILAAIAVPNFLEAQVRAKTSRCHADMRTLVTALTSYKVDTNKWITDYEAFARNQGIGVKNPGDPFIWGQLTTPIAYMGSVPLDGFQGTSKAVDAAGAGANTFANTQTYFYYADGWLGVVLAVDWVAAGGFLGEYIMASPGPDKSWGYGEWNFFKPEAAAGFPRMYDSSNGTVSYGDIVRWGP